MKTSPSLLPDIQFPSNTTWNIAYKVCRDLEEQSLLAQEPRSNTPHLILARILGYMVIHAPCNEGRDAISSEVLSCQSDEELIDLANKYYCIYLRCFKAARKRTHAAPSPEPVILPFVDRDTLLKYLLEEAPQTYLTAKSKALMRDNYRCVLTHHYDYTSYYNDDDLQLANSENMRLSLTHACHIFPKTAHADLAEHTEGSISPPILTDWAVMSRYGQVNLVEELHGNRVHRMENVLTMDSLKQHMLETFQIWLCETDILNQYKVEASRREAFIDLPESRLVTFTTPDPVSLPLPSSIYLRLHAACAQVVHLSGAGEHIFSVLKTLDHARVLNDDGSSAEILDAALASITIS